MHVEEFVNPSEQKPRTSTECNVDIKNAEQAEGGAVAKVLYLFAGEERQSDLGNTLVNKFDEKVHMLELPARISVENVDILRDPDGQNLLNSKLRSKFLGMIAARCYDIVVCAPPCNTFSRALWHDDYGPARVRDRASPWGFQNLTGRLREKCMEANALIVFSMEVAEAVTACTSKFVGLLLEFPEDLGSLEAGTPASIWQFERLKELQQKGMVRGAVHQCELAPIDFAKPTGLLCNIQPLFDDPLFHRGWPSLVRREDQKDFLQYTGPLPRQCSHGGHQRLIGPADGGGWKTSPAAAYPPGMCDFLAEKLLCFLLQQLSGQVQLRPPSAGGAVWGSLHSARDLFPGEIDAIEDAIGKQCGLKDRASSQFGWLPTVGLVGDVSMLSALNVVIDKISLRMGAPFLWSTFRVNLNLSAGWHHDDVDGIVLVAVGGDFDNGELIIDKIGQYALKNQAILFRGGSWHRVAAFTGRRWSLVAFLHPDLAGSSFDMVVLKSLGFRAVASHRPSLIAPRRIKVSKEALADPAFVYIGRGCSRYGLGPSVWGNPFKPSGKYDKKRALKAYKALLTKSPGLLKELEMLGGKMLACHCGSEEECHGDIIIEEYMNRFIPEFDGEPPTAEEALDRAADRKRQAGLEEPIAPTKICGVGSPLYVGSGPRRRLLADGGGLCSRGLWRPESRHPQTEFGSRFCDVLLEAIENSGFSTQQLLDRAVEDDISSSPFPDAVVGAARAGVKRVLDDVDWDWPMVGQIQHQVGEGKKT